jgi:hypothetical protein
LGKTHFGTETIWVFGKLNELVRGKIDTGGGTTAVLASPRETRSVDLREVVDHNGDGGGIEDLLEETEDSLSVISHSESKVPFDISPASFLLISYNVPGQMTIEWVAPASAASLVSSIVVAADPPERQFRAESSHSI